MDLKRLFILIVVLLTINFAVLKLTDRNLEEIEQNEIVEMVPTQAEVTAIRDTIDFDTRMKLNDEVYQSRQNAITTAIEQVKPAVVSVNVIKTEYVQTSPFNSMFFDFYRGFLPRTYKREVQNLGSGVIITEDGYVITNSHVVENATEIRVYLNDGRNFQAEVIGTDEVHDIAVIKLKDVDEQLPSAHFGDSDDIIIGEWTIALGNPFGYLIKDSEPTVTVGVVSALNRNFHSNEDRLYKKMIQTDAAINPGNSGGPLVNINGEIIGINTFIFSKSGGSLGMGFAIPANRVKHIIQEIIQYGGIRPIWFGFKVQDITPSIAQSLGLERTDGVIVSFIQKEGPAEEAGLQRGDIIIEIDKQIVKDTDDAEIAVSDGRIGEALKIRVIRDGLERELSLTPREYKDRKGSIFKL
ncbi:MAG TPA: trypsin-like serine protease [Candidatus Cloacimonetes bacterium]|nr:trypsin-like serine protease [Candidatus Cloacimonadota bacterium]HEX38258.1 trypsin-like serine protease [Candidatus Cloacimonadota bacterium]